MDRYENENRENTYERVCKLYGICGRGIINIFDSSRITLYGLYQLNKHRDKYKLKASY